MAEVGSFASATETTYGSGDRWDTITIESRLRDGQNFRRSMSVHIPGVPFAGASEFALVRGEAYLTEPEGGITSAEVSTPPTYNLPDDMTGLERLGDETVDDMRVYRLRGARPSSTGNPPLTVILYIDTATLLLIRSETRGTTYVADADMTIEGLSTTSYSRFNEDFDIVPPGPTATSTPDPTPTPR